ncbi:DUF4373 domain-containing protein [Chryseobacterium sp. M5A1_1a]
MARPIKVGLDYFPLDTNIDSDDKIELVESEFGSKGFAVVIKLFCKIYADKGYYYSWTEKEKLLFAKRTGEAVGLVDEIVKRSVKWGLFDESVFNQFQILTSSAIQSRFLEATNRREKIEMYKEFLLIVVSDYKNGVNVNINSINVNISTQSKVKESKVKEIKENIPPIIPQGDQQEILFQEEKKYKPSEQLISGSEEKEKSSAKKEKVIQPDLETFVDFARSIYQNELKLDFSLFEFAVRAKYESWNDAGWKDGHKKPIQVWKNKLRSLIPYFKPIYKNGQSSNNYTNNGNRTDFGNTTRSNPVSGKKSASSILAERIRNQATGNGYS